MRPLVNVALLILVSGCASNPCLYTKLHSRPSTTDKPILTMQAKQYDTAVADCKAHPPVRMHLDEARNNY